MDAQLRLFDEAELPPDARRVGPASVDDRLHAIARRLPPGLRLGTSSWSFPGWEGIVYDRRASEATLARDGLSAYAAHPLLRTVGVDRTFYRPIGVAELRAYAAAVPDHFRFVVKADRLLTTPVDPEPFGIRGQNPRFLDPVYAAEEVVGPLVEGLGPKAGPLLFQFPPIPPNLVGGRAAFLRRLQAFLERLPSGPRYAVELRTPAFFGDGYARVLEATGVTHCHNVHPAMTPLERQLEQIGPFHQAALVVRWMLNAGFRYEVARDRYSPFHTIVDEDAPTRERLAVAVLDALVAEREVFVVANNKAEGSAPLSVFALAERIAAWTERPLVAEPSTAPVPPDAP